SLRNRDFVEAARVSGEGRIRIIVVELLPNLIPIVAASFLFTTLAAVGAYVAIAFLGLAGSPTSSPPGLWNWGDMLREGFANNAIRGGWWWWWAPPGLCVALLGTGLALLNFGIDEFINPRLRNAGLSQRGARKAGISLSTTLGITPVLGRRQASSAIAARSSSVTDAVLEIHGLSVDYGYGEDAVHAVADCDLVLRRGRVLVGDLGRPAERAQRAQPRHHRRRPVRRPAARAPPAALRVAALAEIGGAARHGGHERRPAAQLPARALRRDAPARHDRHGPR